MKVTGSFFVEDSVEAHAPGDGAVIVVFDGSGGMFVHMTEQQAEQLRFELTAVLDGLVHDG